MIRQIYSDYHLPMNPMELTLFEIRFWYEPLIPGLLKLAEEQRKRKGKR